MHESEEKHWRSASNQVRKAYVQRVFSQSSVFPIVVVLYIPINLVAGFVAGESASASGYDRGFGSLLGMIASSLLLAPFFLRFRSKVVMQFEEENGIQGNNGDETSERLKGPDMNGLVHGESRDF